jgi:GNAT superfamily N-acetyltransferase
MTDTLRVERLHGAAIAQQLPGLARLRIQVFREFPYLYEGSEDYERNYLQTYLKSPDSLFVLVFDGDRLVGASSGLPLVDEVADMRRPFEAQGYDLSKIFYCGESVLLPEYRGRGLGVRFFEEREAHARSLGRFEKICFCAVERPEDHPRRPVDYVPLNAFWQRRGYQQQPDLRTTFLWRDLDETTESPKPMVFWMKAL